MQLTFEFWDLIKIPNIEPIVGIYTSQIKLQDLIDKELDEINKSFI